MRLDIYSGSQLSHNALNSDEEALMLLEIEEEKRLINKQSNTIAFNEELDYNKNTKWL